MRVCERASAASCSEFAEWQPAGPLPERVAEFRDASVHPWLCSCYNYPKLLPAPRLAARRRPRRLRQRSALGAAKAASPSSAMLASGSAVCHAMRQRCSMFVRSTYMCLPMRRQRRAKMPGAREQRCLSSLIHGPPTCSVYGAPPTRERGRVAERHPRSAPPAQRAPRRVAASFRLSACFICASAR